MRKSLGLLLLVGTASMANSVQAESLAELLPEKIREAGAIRAAAPLDFPPYGWLDADSIEAKGFEPDVGRAIGELLGVEWVVEDIKWEGLITGIGSGRHDIGSGGMSDKVERRANGNFVDFATTSIAVVTRQADAGDFKTVEDLCGKSVGSTIGTTTVLVGKELSDNCVSLGKEPITVNEYPNLPANDLALKSGREPAIIVSTEQAGHAISTGAQDWHMIGSGYMSSPTGFLVTKTVPGLDEAILAAAQELYRSGELQRIAEQYGLSQSLMEPRINAAEE